MNSSSSETIAAKTRRTARLLRAREREGEPDVRQKQPSKAERDVGLGALPRLPMHILLSPVHIYIANMQYIRNYRAAYKYTYKLLTLAPQCALHACALVNDVIIRLCVHKNIGGFKFGDFVAHRHLLPN